ncbi:MAG TPA: hypothetical protein VLM84_02070 [Chromatiaceae bacterium]|jgi:hypothetical protein|nr:hypothetical protein [Chromatiaceae bacterium]
MTLTIILIIAVALLFGRRPTPKRTRIVAGIETTARVVPAPEAPDYRTFIHPAYARKRGPKAEELRRTLAEFRRDDPALMGVDDLTRRVAAELRAQTGS